MISDTAPIRGAPTRRDLMATPSIPDLFQQLADAARELDRESALINEFICSYETRLRAVPIDVDVWMAEDLATEDIGTVRWHISLGFARLDEGWHLAIQRRDQHYRKDGPIKLLDAQRQIRELALMHLPELIGQMIFIAKEERWSCERTRKNLAAKDGGQRQEPPALVQ
jgi:hypothetical protein